MAPAAGAEDLLGHGGVGLAAQLKHHSLPLSLFGEVASHALNAEVCQFLESISTHEDLGDLSGLYLASLRELLGQIKGLLGVGGDALLDHCQEVDIGAGGAHDALSVSSHACGKVGGASLGTFSLLVDFGGQSGVLDHDNVSKFLGVGNLVSLDPVLDEVLLVLGKNDSTNLLRLNCVESGGLEKLEEVLNEGIGFALLNRLLTQHLDSLFVSDETLWGVSGDFGGLSILLAHNKSVELLGEVLLGAGESVSDGEVESDLLGVGDLGVVLDVVDQVAGVCVNADHVALGVEEDGPAFGGGLGAADDADLGDLRGQDLGTY